MAQLPPPGRGTESLDKILKPTNDNAKPEKRLTRSAARLKEMSHPKVSFKRKNPEDDENMSTRSVDFDDSDSESSLSPAKSGSTPSNEDADTVMRDSKSGKTSKYIRPIIRIKPPKRPILLVNPRPSLTIQPSIEHDSDSDGHAVTIKQENDSHPIKHQKLSSSKRLNILKSRDPTEVPKSASKKISFGPRISSQLSSDATEVLDLNDKRSEVVANWTTSRIAKDRMSIESTKERPTDKMQEQHMLSEHYKLPTTLPEDAELADLLGGPPKAMDQFVMQCMYRDVHDDSETTFVGNLDVLTHDSKKALEQLDLRLYNKWKQEIKAAGLAKSGTDFVEARQAFWCAFYHPFEFKCIVERHTRSLTERFSEEISVSSHEKSALVAQTFNFPPWWFDGIVFARRRRYPKEWTPIYRGPTPASKFSDMQRALVDIIRQIRKNSAVPSVENGLTASLQASSVTPVLHGQDNQPVAQGQITQFTSRTRLYSDLNMNQTAHAYVENPNCRAPHNNRRVPATQPQSMAMSTNQSLPSLSTPAVQHPALTHRTLHQAPGASDFGQSQVSNAVYNHSMGYNGAVGSAMQSGVGGSMGQPILHSTMRQNNYGSLMSLNAFKLAQQRRGQGNPLNQQANYPAMGQTAGSSFMGQPSAASGHPAGIAPSMEDGAAFLDDMFELWQIAGSRLDPSFVQFPPEVMNQKLEKYAAALSRCEGHYKTLSGLMGTARQVYADARKIAAGEDYGQKLAGRKSRSSTPQLPADARLSAAGEDYEQKLAERMRRSSSVQGQNSRQSNVANNIGQSNQFSVPALLARQKTKSSSASPVKGAQTRDENSVRETIHNSLALRRSASIPSGDPLSRLQSASSPLITRTLDASEMRPMAFHSVPPVPMQKITASNVSIQPSWATNRTNSALSTQASGDHSRASSVVNLAEGESWASTRNIICPAPLSTKASGETSKAESAVDMTVEESWDSRVNVHHSAH